ncbi:hypothetical protein ACLOJK_009073 [Asimina triloba]
MSSSSSSSAPPPPIPIEWLRAFHKIERGLFIRFVFHMGRDPIQSMQFIALWLWLEEVGFPNITSKLKALSTQVVEAAIQESEACLDCLRRAAEAGPWADPALAFDDNVPVLAGLMERAFSLRFLRENRDAAVLGISYVLSNVCARIFEDLHRLATGGEGSSSRQRTDVGEVMVSTSWLRLIQQSSTRPAGSDLASTAGILMMQRTEESSSSSRMQRFLVPGHDLSTLESGIFPAAAAGIGMSGSSMEAAEMQSSLNPRATTWAPGEETSSEDRTMFLTFSRGYPLAEEDIREFFTRNWGECIEQMQMQETALGVQPLFARVVLYSAATVPLILGGQEKAKLVINGKHVWVRPFITQKIKPSPSPTKESE